MTQLDDFAARLAAMEERLANLSVGDLPLAALQRKMEADWQPNGAVLLESKSIGASLLADGAVKRATLDRTYIESKHGGTPKLDYGTVVVTFAAAQQSANSVVSHALGVPPASIVATQVNTTASIEVGVISVSASTITFRGFVTTGAATTGSVTFYWIALG